MGKDEEEQEWEQMKRNRSNKREQDVQQKYGSRRQGSTA